LEHFVGISAIDGSVVRFSNFVNHNKSNAMSLLLLPPIYGNMNIEDGMFLGLPDCCLVEFYYSLSLSIYIYTVKHTIFGRLL